MNRSQLIEELQRIVGPGGVVADPVALMTYDADGCVMDTGEPQVVALPTSAEQVSGVVRLAARHGVPIVPRGAGTGLSGGATAIGGGIVVSTARMDRVLEIDARNGRVLCQPGVINWELSQLVKPYGYQFAPDPSSQKACTVGGNIANNAGGPHCLKYGTTSSHVLGVQMVLPDGSIIWTGDGNPAPVGYDLTGVVTGSEGTIGLVTAAWLKLTRLPEAVRVVLALFPDIAGASASVSQVIASGFLPAALEIMDRLAIKAVNDMYKLGLPEQAGAALLIEVDGVDDGLDELLADMTTICWRNGALDVRPARTPAEQNQSGRRARTPSAQWVAWPRRTTWLTRWCRAPACPIRWSRSGASPRSTACRSPTCSMPATATCTRSFSSTGATGARTSGRWRRPQG